MRVYCSELLRLVERLPFRGIFCQLNCSVSRFWYLLLFLSSWHVTVGISLHLMNYSKEIRDRPMIPNSSSNGNSYASGSDEYANSAYFRFNIEVTSARIDESHMPEHLRHHQWTMDRVLGEGK
ncbi:unnamed protein product [Thelazia callipaeda]|uniref:Uncharacterized protein n=1 Tax=Thelazia callipaeda TaxID=103827 RepID=A0A0N5D9I5_THECL|nr:unnamed protein product [Thelazia callipaeda]